MFIKLKDVKDGPISKTVFQWIRIQDKCPIIAYFIDKESEKEEQRQSVKYCVVDDFGCVVDIDYRTSIRYRSTYLYTKRLARETGLPHYILGINSRGERTTTRKIKP